MNQFFTLGTHGSDSNPGTLQKPLKTVSAGVAKARASASQKTVAVRAGTYYLSDPISLTEADSGLTLQNYDGEEVWLSGAAPVPGV